jgi:hypothetical protein
MSDPPSASVRGRASIGLGDAWSCYARTSPSVRETRATVPASPPDLIEQKH